MQEGEDEGGNGTPLLGTGLEAVSSTSGKGSPQQATHLKGEVVALHTSCAKVLVFCDAYQNGHCNIRI